MYQQEHVGWCVEMVCLSLRVSVLASVCVCVCVCVCVDWTEDRAMMLPQRPLSKRLRIVAFDQSFARLRDYNTMLNALFIVDAIWLHSNIVYNCRLEFVSVFM